MSRFKEGTTTQRERYSYTYTYAENRNWIFCPNCARRLFEVIKGKGFIIEIKCHSCRKLIKIEQ